MIKATILKDDLKIGKYSELLKDIYVDENLIDYQQARYIKAIDKYVDLYGDTDVEIYSAPGRSEVGGNHTDHQHGCVLAAAVNLDAIAVVGRVDNKIKVLSDDFDIAPINLEDLEIKKMKSEHLRL